MRFDIKFGMYDGIDDSFRQEEAMSVSRVGFSGDNSAFITRMEAYVKATAHHTQGPQIGICP